MGSPRGLVCALLIAITGTVSPSACGPSPCGRPKVSAWRLLSPPLALAGHRVRERAGHATSPSEAEGHTPHTMDVGRDGGEGATTSSSREDDLEQGRSRFTVTVRSLDGTEWRLPVELSTTVLEIKRGVKAHPVQQQRLIYLGAFAPLSSHFCISYSHFWANVVSLR